MELIVVHGFHFSALWTEYHHIISTLLSDLMHHPQPSDALLTQEMLCAGSDHMPKILFF